MRLIGSEPMTGAERSRRWRLRVKLGAVARMVAQDIAQLPLWVDPSEAAPIVEAWHMRGLVHPITVAQWSTIAVDELGNPQVRAVAVAAIADGPKAPAPAFAVWGTLLVRLQRMRAHIVSMLKPKAVAHAYHAPPQDDAPPPYEGMEGHSAWEAVGARLFGRAPCSCSCHRDMKDRCKDCREHHAHDPRVPTNERPPVLAVRFGKRARK